MKTLILPLLLTITSMSLFAQVPKPEQDPYAVKWDVNCQPKGCLMFLDIAHGDPSNPSYLTITVAIKKINKSVAFISFKVPDSADRNMGLALGFGDSYKKENGEWGLKLAEDTTRVLKFDSHDSDTFTAREINGIVPSNTESSSLNLLDQFLNHRLLFFFYWVKGQRVRASTTLSGFQAQYPIVLKEKL